MSVGELWVQSPIFPWLLMILTFWVGTSTILMWRMWFKIKNLQNHNKLLQELMMGGISGLKEQINNQTNQGRKRSKFRRTRSKEKYTGKLCTKRRRIPSEERKPENNTETRENSHLEVPSSIEIQTSEGAEYRDKTTAQIL